MDKSALKRNYASNRDWGEYLSTGVEVVIIVAVVTTGTIIECTKYIFIKTE